VAEMLAFLNSAGVVDAHAADQLLTLAALSPYESRFVTERVTDHLRTNAEIIRQLARRQIDIEAGEKDSGVVTVREAE
jgi:RNA 3'-terminal phosphate cyclase